MLRAFASLEEMLARSAQRAQGIGSPSQGQQRQSLKAVLRVAVPLVLVAGLASCSATSTTTRTETAPTDPCASGDTAECAIVVVPVCERGSRWDGKTCALSCPEGQHFEVGKGCTEGGPRPAADVLARDPAPPLPPTVRITNPGSIYSTINQTECLDWANEEMKRRAGAAEWARSGYYPAAGDLGVVVHRASHCLQPGVVVLIVRVGDNLVPIGSTGVTFLQGVPP